MDFEDLRKSARERFQAVTADHPTLALPRIFLSKEARSTSLASLVENLLISASEQSTTQVGS